MAVVVFAISSSAFVQGAAAGNVTDASDGSPLWGAVVMVGEKAVGTTTHGDGEVRLQNVPAGTTGLVWGSITLMHGMLTGYENHGHNSMEEHALWEME